MTTVSHFGEHFNARGLSPDVIADSFVAPRQFWEVSAHSNTVLVGPRGSGKTTLLRMLDPRALGRWVASPSCRSVEGWSVPEYIGVFVPIDTAWVSSLTNVATTDTLAGRDDLYLAIYTLSVAKCLTEVMRWRLLGISEGSKSNHLRVNAGIESELVRHLGEIFIANGSLRSLLELRIELAKKIAILPYLWETNPGARQSLLTSGLANPLASTAAACEVFNTLADEPHRKWSLLCDELEIAPLVIRTLLFSGLRAVPSPLLLKMALTPKEQIGASETGESPLPANDYEVVSLSYPTREEGAPEKEREEFCIALWESLVDEIGGDLPSSLHNPFKAFEEPRRTSSRRGPSKNATQSFDSKFGGIFRSLALKDRSFWSYLNAKEINVDDLDDNEAAKRDAVLRKVRPIVEIRDHNLRLDDDGRLARVPRRSPNLYGGARRVFAVSEGHPRWLKYTLGAMLRRVASKSPYIRLTDQSRELRHAGQRIDARLKALPVRDQSPHELVQTLGAFFSQQILGEVFKADPVLSFTVDDGVSVAIEDAVAQALYLGALVPLQADVFHLFTKGLRGRRFRLSNWLAPTFSLPLMTGKAINLSSILGGQIDQLGLGVDTPQFTLELRS